MIIRLRKVHSYKLAQLSHQFQSKLFIQIFKKSSNFQIFFLTNRLDRLGKCITDTRFRLESSQIINADDLIYPSNK